MTDLLRTQSSLTDVIKSLTIEFTVEVTPTRSIQDDPESLIRRLHFFPFGALQLTAGWLREFGAGSFRVDGRQDRVAVSREGAWPR